LIAPADVAEHPLAQAETQCFERAQPLAQQAAATSPAPSIPSRAHFQRRKIGDIPVIRGLIGCRIFRM
jgi:hypothetical protein